MINQTIISEFILLGFSNDRKINISLFLFFSLIYVITIVGNCLIFCVILINPKLHTPMYFFLINLSFIDLCNISSAAPKLLVDILSAHRTISLIACTIQLYVLLLIGVNECMLLALMAYDRYVAICHSLHYPLYMRWSVCYSLSAFVWVFSFMLVLLPSFSTKMTFCHYNQINHCMCEVLAVMKLACNHGIMESYSEIVIFAVSFISLLLPFVLIIVSYVCIIYSVLKIRSAGRSKAFSTCTSHITIVAMYYGMGMVSYLGPSGDYFLNKEKYVSIFYVIIAPMLNPVIYSLNNREVKRSIRRLL